VRFRKDIEGLRAVAILPVVFYHAFRALAPGGFIGVDVFFVISGYLITGIIVGELQDGTFSLASFYQRRVRRIFPALFFMLTVAVVLAFTTLPPRAMAEFGRTLVATVLFTSNLQFERLSGYFDGSGDLKPLLHTWSLAVEEQFYIVFPLLLLVIHRWLRVRFLTVLLPVAVLALAKSLWAFHRAPIAAFYLAPNRAIELLIGSMVAVAALPAMRLRLWREVVTAGGLALIVGSVVIYSDQTPFPGWRALVPCLGAALIIYGGRDGESTVCRLLGWRPVRYIGAISFALYLWHWPLLVFARHYTLGQISGAGVAAVVGVAFVAAAVSGRFVERPFRVARQAIDDRWAFGAAAASICGFAILGLAAVADQGVPQRFSAQAVSMFSYSTHFNHMRPACHAERNMEIAYANSCVYGAVGVPPYVAVWGDSHGAELVVGLGELAKPGGGSVMQLTSSACPPAAGYSTEFRPNCGAHNEAILWHLVRDPRIREVILVANYQEYYSEDWPVLMAGLEASVTRLEHSGKDVTLVYPVPTFHYPVPDALGESINRGESPAQYRVARSDYLRANSLAIAALDALAARHKVNRVYPADALCDASSCRAYDGHSALYWDDYHVSIDGAQVLAPQFRSVLALAGAPGRH
jgi:peptidoglycan/LPS O-acetylase OafA/YrhL